VKYNVFSRQHSFLVLCEWAQYGLERMEHEMEIEGRHKTASLDNVVSCYVEKQIGTIIQC